MASVLALTEDKMLMTISQKHLVLFDNSEMLEPRHVFALSHYNVDIHAGGDAIPEGELWIKRNCIRLWRKQSLKDTAGIVLPIFLFSDNCSEKEDFYHALLHNVEAESTQDGPPPAPQPFETEDMMRLIRQIHLSDEHIHTRYLNAILGRLFLALYKTQDIEDLIRAKIEKKISRVAKPNFITSIALTHVDMGHAAPSIANPKLKEMTVDGALTIECDIKYTGHFTIVVAAIARIELGSRFKPREVTLVLRGILKKLEGHLLVKIKPPPSNRLWIAFETVPKMDLALEPVVSSRQITYGVILRAMESRIREVIAETLVSPNFDDIPFKDTFQQHVRGGIWKRDDVKIETPSHSVLSSDESALLSGDSNSIVDLQIDKTLEGHPSAEESDSPSGSPVIRPETPKADISLVVPSTDSPIRSSAAHKPRAMRTSSFAYAANPVVNVESANVDSANRAPRSGKARHDATSSMKILADRSPEASPTTSPSGSLSRDSHLSGLKFDSNSSKEKPIPNHHRSTSLSGTASSGIDVNVLGDSLLSVEDPSITISGSTTPTKRSNADRARSIVPSAETRKSINQSVGSAAAAAKTWGWGVLQRQNMPKLGQKSHDSRKPVTSPDQPIGRGHPLPPPGMPLPRPSSIDNNWPTTGLGSYKRKPVGSSAPSSSLGALQAAAKAAGQKKESKATSEAEYTSEEWAENEEAEQNTHLPHYDQSDMHAAEAEQKATKADIDIQSQRAEEVDVVEKLNFQRRSHRRNDSDIINPFEEEPSSTSLSGFSASIASSP